MLSETFAHGAPLANSVSRQSELCESPQAARGHQRVPERRCGDSCHTAACDRSGMGSRGGFVPGLLRRTQPADQAGEHGMPSPAMRQNTHETPVFIGYHASA